MIVLISLLEPGRIERLSQFVAHYRGLGVDRFLLSLQIEPNTPEAEKRAQQTRFEQTLTDLEIDEAHYLEREYDAMAMGEHHSRLQDEKVAPGDWIVWADSDEMQIHPKRLPEMAAWCEENRADLLRGIVIDRVAADGGLPPFNPNEPIWRTFPLTCAVTAAFTKGAAKKIAFARGSIKLTGGKHFVAAGDRLRAPTGWVQIHHFKWDATVIERLRYRVRPEWRAKCRWWHNSQRMLDYFAANNQRFNLADLKPVVLDGPELLIFDEDTGRRAGKKTAGAVA